MKEIPLTRGFVAIVDDADIEWLSQWKWHVVTSKTTAYARRSYYDELGIKRKISMHHQLMGRPPVGMVTDHKNGNGLDNRRENLRAATPHQNIVNRRHARRLLPKGVRRAGFLKYEARITIGRKKKYLGSFGSISEAADAYDKAAIELWGEFAVLNKGNWNHDKIVALLNS